jgi:Cu/Ag efflux protein CusF
MDDIRDELRAPLRSPYTWFAFGVAAILGVWWWSMTPNKANATLVFGVVAFTMAIFLHPWVVRQPPSARIFWAGFTFCSLSLLVYYFLWSTAATKSQIAASSSSAKSLPVRQFVDVSPTDLIGLYHTKTTYQADLAAASYKGRWIVIKGNVSDVSKIRGGTAMHVGMFAPKTQAVESPHISMVFDVRFESVLSQYLNGSAIEAVCQIDEINDLELRAINCELKP